jgi:SAM-dependent methyltransferase
MAYNQKVCLICGGKPEKTRFSYTKPDRYERWVGIENIKRMWVMCEDCGFHWQMRNYPLSKLETIYVDGYRDPKFRGETIQAAFSRIQSYRVTGNSENEVRYIWFAANIKYKEAKKVLDVGSGLGVWPRILKDAGFVVTCVDENKDSVKFISEELGMQCYRHLNDVVGKFDTVSLVHVLEHIQDIDGFLRQVRLSLRAGGYLFVEAPGDAGFDFLSKYHDDFNSCHQWFFSSDSLHQILKRNGFKPFTQGVRNKHGKSRLLMLCK